MSKKYLGITGLTYFFNKIKALIPKKTSELINDSNYVTNMDYGTGTVGGVIKWHNEYATNIDSNGYLKCDYNNYSVYKMLSNNSFISKGTLEKVFEGKTFKTEDEIKQLITTEINKITDANNNSY